MSKPFFMSYSQLNIKIQGRISSINRLKTYFKRKKGELNNCLFKN